jgi:hypothetical protein
MANSGIYPLDPTTDVGKFRLLFGDTASVPFIPATPGLQDYTDYSDAEIQQFIISGGGVLNRGVGFAYLQASGAAARESKAIKDYDLSVDLTKRAEDLRKTAQLYFDMADLDDANAGISDSFIVAPTGTSDDLWQDDIEGFPYWPGLRG